jgi:hypothetical protein
MVNGIIGRKVGMTQVFAPDGTVTPATGVSPGADCDDAHGDPRVFFECRQQLRKQAGLLGRRRRGDGDEALRRP